jgi:hypothetical protein
MTSSTPVASPAMVAVMETVLLVSCTGSPLIRPFGGRDQTAP